MNYLLIAILVVFLLSVLLGVIRGFVKSISVFASSFAAIFIACLVLNPVTDWVCDNLSVYDRLQDMCRQKIEEAVWEKAGDVVGDALEGAVENILPGQAEAIGSLSSEKLEELGELLEGTDLVEALSDRLTTLQQASLIESLPVPQTLKDLLTENNNDVAYDALGAENFVEYISGFIALMMIRVAVFIIVFVVTGVVLRAILRALSRVSQVPVLRGVNRLCGGAVGALHALLIVWVVFLILIPLAGTKIGMTCNQLIADNVILNWLFSKNLLLRFLSAWIS